MQAALHVNVIQDLWEMEYHVLVSYLAVLNIDKNLVFTAIQNIL